MPVLGMNACMPIIANASPLHGAVNIAIIGIFQKTKLLRKVRRVNVLHKNIGNVFSLDIKRMHLIICLSNMPKRSIH